MSTECDSIWLDLAIRRVGEGDPVEDLTNIKAPERVENIGPYQQLSYHPDGLCFTGITIMAKDGKLLLAHAWSCTWQHAFFENEDESANVQVERRKYWESFAIREEADKSDD